MYNRHIKIWFNSLAVAITVLLFISGCSNNVQDVRDLSMKRKGIEEAETVTAYMSEGAKRKAKLTAPFMRHETQDTAKMIFPKSIHVEFYNDSTGKVESRVFAKYAVNYENMGRVLLQDSVLCYNLIGDTLRTNELWWDRNRQTFYTDKHVHIRQAGNDIQGSGLRSDQAFKDIHIINPNGLMDVPDSTTRGN